MARHRLIPTLFLVSVLAVVSCDSPIGPSEPLPVTRILQGSFSSAETPQRLVLRTSKEFQDAWAALFVNVTMMPMPLDIDFSREMVIIVTLGAKPSGGYCIAVDAVSGNRRRADVTVRSKGPSPLVLPVVTHPFDVVRVPRRDEVLFTEVSELGNCGIIT